MIQESVVQYTVSDTSLGFEITVNDKKQAEKIEENLTNTKSIISVINNFRNSKDYHKSSASEVVSVKEKFIIDNNGNLNGIVYHYKNTQIDTWEGRPSITQNSSEDIMGEDFIEKIINPIIKEINTAIKQMKDINPCTGMYAFIPKDVFDYINTKINYYNRYSAILNDFKYGQLWKQKKNGK